MVKRVVSLIMLIVSLSIFTGCWDNKIYEKIGFLLDVSIDKGDDDQFNVTYSYPVLEKNKTRNVTLVKIDGYLLRDSREKARQKTPRLVEGGKIQNILISKEVAREGIHDIITLFERDPLLPLISKICIIEGECRGFMEKATLFIDKPIPAIYINNLLSNNEKNYTAKETRIYQYDIDYFNGNRDPIIPVLKIKDEDIILTNSALFHKDKLVGEVSPSDTCLLLDLRLKNTEHEVIFYSLGIDNLIYKKATSMNLKQKSKSILIDTNSEIPVVDIYIEYTGVIDDFPWFPLDDKDNKEMVEQKLSNEIECRILEVIKYTQEVGSDPVGISHIIKAKHNKYWKTINWDDVYKKIKFRVHASIKVDRFGVIK